MSEEVGIFNDGVACYVRTVNENKFEVEFTKDSMELLTDPRMAVIANDWQMPVGEMNQMWLVEKLNVFINTYMEKSQNAN